MKVEELINSDSLIVVDGEYTDGTIRQAYTEGYNEAMRWRDPVKELPLIDKIKYPNGNYSDDVICKDIEGTNYIAYYDHDEKKWCFTMEGEDYTIQITKWRPIE